MIIPKKRFSADVPAFIEIRGRETLLCEGMSKITEYSAEKICLSGASGGIFINGKGLTLRHLSKNRIAIDGRIDGIGFIQTG